MVVDVVLYIIKQGESLLREMLVVHKMIAYEEKKRLTSAS